MKKFLDISNFRPLTEIENIKLDYSGLYALRVRDISSLPITINNPIIYIGKGKVLSKRLEEECRGKRNGTFFRGIGALLNFKPPKGSLLGKSNLYNYKFSKEDCDKIVNWMNENLVFSYVKLGKNITTEEKKLIMSNCPILNTIHNPFKSENLAKLRYECRLIALSK